MWTVTPEWAGETVFIIAGGPSVTQEHVDSLKGRRVIVVNSSYERAPWADILFFGDLRWWQEHHKHLKDFSGRIVTCAANAREENPPRLLRLQKVAPSSGLSDKPNEVVFRRTSLASAINLAVHLGVSRIVLLGVDNGAPHPSGKTHHHRPHKWAQQPGCWDEQKDDLDLTAAACRKRGIEVINTSPVSRLDCWPKVPLADVLADLDSVDDAA